MATITAVSIFTVACHHEESPAPLRGAETQLQAGMATRAHSCPMGVPGTTVTTSDSPQGMTVDLATSSSDRDVEELRRRVHTMAEAGTLGMMRGPGGGGGRAGRVMAREAVQVPRPHTKVEDTGRGVRLTLEPGDKESVAELRARVKAHTQRMASNHECMGARAAPPER
jgi:hypothetical protein